MPHNKMHWSVHKPHHLQHAVTSKQSLLAQSYSCFRKALKQPRFSWLNVQCL